jgi:hypothetical protein
MKVRQLAAPPAPNPLGPILLQIIERTYMPSLIPGCPPVLVKTVEGKLEAF